MMLLALTSCNKEEDLIIGTWITTGQSYTQNLNDTIVISTQYRPDSEYIYEFKRNGKYTSATPWQLENGHEPKEYSYSIENGKLTFENGSIYEILELTKKKLVIQREETWNGFRTIYHWELVKK